MSVADIASILKPTGIAVGLIILGKLIKIKSLDVDLFGWLGRQLGKSINAGVVEQIKILQNQQQETKKIQQDIALKLDDHIAEGKREEALSHRKEILRFVREEMNGTQHPRESWIEVLQDVDEYEEFCSIHSHDFQNNRATAAIKYIKDRYDDKLRNGGFIGE